MVRKTLPLVEEFKCLGILLPKKLDQIFGSVTVLVCGGEAEAQFEVQAC